MASAKRTNFALCFLLIATFATCFLIILHNSFMNTHESSRKGTNFATSVSYEEDAFVHKVYKNGEYVGDHKRLSGRKMLQREDKSKKRSEEAKLDGSNHESNISGSFPTTKTTDHWISPAAPFEVSNNSKVGNQDSKKINDDESEEISEAADEVVSMMMRKDYKEPDRPRHKPPINNHNPTDGP